jgi:stage III sporulation protein AC
MDINLVFKIAAIGIIVSILNRLLNQSGREEMAMMTTLAGTVVVLLMIIGMITKLFDTVKTMFQL